MRRTIAGATREVERGLIRRAARDGMSWDCARPSTWVMPRVPGAVIMEAAVQRGGELLVPSLIRGEFHG